MRLTLGFSPCPNDTFMFDGMVHSKIDTEGLEFEPVLRDVELLNQSAFEEEFDITKISYHAYLRLIHSYLLLNSGSALGHRCGPLLISKNSVDIRSLSENQIGIPGKWTTANFLLQFFLQKKINARIFVFSEIEQALLDEAIQAGVIIHENRFTYESKGLKKIQDLGEHWESETGSPIPLGGIVTRRKFDQELLSKIDRVMRRSVEFAFVNPGTSRAYVKKHAQEMDEAVIQQHIQLYVNDHSIDLGEAGRKAVTLMLHRAAQFHDIPIGAFPLFIGY